MTDETSADTADIAAALGPLLDALRESRGLRLIARPGSVVIDRAEGRQAVEVPWSQQQHQVVLPEVSGLRTLEDGCTVACLGEALVLCRPPTVLRRLDDWARDGWISALAGRMLGRAHSLGRNILIVGPWAGSVELIGALLAEATCPALVGADFNAVAPSWVRLSNPAEARHYGPDRIGAWSLSMQDLADLMCECSGVAAWCDAGRLDRALIRFERTVYGGSEQAGPLQVLSGVDLMVVLGAQGGAPRVQQITEIALGPEGYQSRILFSTGRPPMTNALVPVALPTFIGDFAQAGDTVLVDDLKHAMPAVAAAPVAQEPVLEAAPAEIVPVVPEQPQADAVRIPPVLRPPAPVPLVDTSDASPPGWEVDELDEEQIEDAQVGHPDDALMAATYGLGPPPAPAAVADPSAGGAFQGTFADALARAKERDENWQNQLGRVSKAEPDPEG